MKETIHPTYYPQAKVTCAGCSTVFTIGSTKEAINVELCSNCHPFYTGKQKLVDTAGRVDRFRARAAKAATKTAPPEPAKMEEPAADDTLTPEDRLAEMKKTLEEPGDKQ